MNIIIKQSIYAFFFVTISSGAIGQTFELNESKVGINFGSDLDNTSIGFTAETPFLDGYGEMSLNLIKDSYKFSFLYKYYTDIELDDLPNLRYYYGLGPSVVINDQSVPDDNTTIWAGVGACAGLDYSFDDIPLIVGLELKPAYYYEVGFYFTQFGLFCKYDLAKHKAK